LYRDGLHSHSIHDLILENVEGFQQSFSKIRNPQSAIERQSYSTGGTGQNLYLRQRKIVKKWGKMAEGLVTTTTLVVWPHKSAKLRSKKPR